MAENKFEGFVGAEFAVNILLLRYMTPFEDLTVFSTLPWDSMKRSSSDFNFFTQRGTSIEIVHTFDNCFKFVSLVLRGIVSFFFPTTVNSVIRSDALRVTSDIRVVHMCKLICDWMYLIICSWMLDDKSNCISDLSGFERGNFDRSTSLNNVSVENISFPLLGITFEEITEVDCFIWL